MWLNGDFPRETWNLHDLPDSLTNNAAEGYNYRYSIPSYLFELNNLLLQSFPLLFRLARELHNIKYPQIYKLMTVLLQEIQVMILKLVFFITISLLLLQNTRINYKNVLINKTKKRRRHRYEELSRKRQQVKQDFDNGEIELSTYLRYIHNKSGLFSCPAILPYSYTVILSLSLCLPGALYIFPSV